MAYIQNNNPIKKRGPLNIDSQTASAMVNVVNLNSTKRGQKLSKRLTKRNQKRTERIDNRELRRKARFEGRDANQGKTYQEKRGTDVGNFFRRFNDPSANQTPPSTTNTNNPQNNYEETKKEENTKLNTNYLSLMDKNPGYFQPKEREDLDHKSVGLSKKYIK